MSDRRRGYALVWTIVTLAVIAALLAAAAPSLAVIDERAKAERTAAELRSIAAAFVQFESTVGNYPGAVSQLTNPLSTSDMNSCHRKMNTGNVMKWPGRAPYVSFYTPPNGLWTELGRIRDSIPYRGFPSFRTPIVLEIPGVRAAQADLLSLVVDHGAGDTVSFAPPVNDTTTIVYRLVPSGLVVNNRC